MSQIDKTTIGDLKCEALSALQADVLHRKSDEDDSMDLVPDFDPEGEWVIPAVNSVDDFELSRAVKDRGRPTGKYTVLSNEGTVKQSLVNWESLFIQFKDEDGEYWHFLVYNRIGCTQTLFYDDTTHTIHPNHPTHMITVITRTNSRQTPSGQGSSTFDHRCGGRGARSIVFKRQTKGGT